MVSWDECGVCRNDFSADPTSTNAPLTGLCGHSVCRGCCCVDDTSLAEDTNACPVCKADNAFSYAMNPSEALCGAIAEKKGENFTMMSSLAVGRRAGKKRRASSNQVSPTTSRVKTEQRAVKVKKEEGRRGNTQTEFENALADYGDGSLGSEAEPEAQGEHATTALLSSAILEVLEKHKIPVTEYGKGITRVSKSVNNYPVLFKHLFPLLDFMLPPDDDDAPTHVQLIYTDHKNDPSKERHGIKSRAFLRKLKAKKTRTDIEEAAVGWHEPKKDWNPKELNVLTALLTVLHDHYEAELAKPP
jgi:hypothetical protein